MSIGIITQFDVNAPLPIDSRLVVANQTARQSLQLSFLYNGLLVYQSDTQELWMLIDKNYNTDDTLGWKRMSWKSVNAFSASAITYPTPVELFAYAIYDNNPFVNLYANCNIEYQMKINNGSWDYSSQSLAMGGRIDVGTVIYRQEGDTPWPGFINGAYVPYTEKTTTNMTPLITPPDSYNSEPISFKFIYNDFPSPYVSAQIYYVTESVNTASICGIYTLTNAFA